MGIQRYGHGRTYGPHDQGTYVLFTDHKQVVAELEQRVIVAEDFCVERDREITRLRAELAAKSKEVQELHSGIAKALDEIEDAGPKALKYAEQELRTAMGEGNGR